MFGCVSEVSGIDLNFDSFTKNFRVICVKLLKERKQTMSAEIMNVVLPTTDGVASIANDSDVEMVNAPELSGAKNSRNVQTQHGDYRTVDEWNIFLIARCLWPEGDQSTSDAATSPQEAKEEEDEQVVWIEPFANEVCFQ